MKKALINLGEAPGLTRSELEEKFPRFLKKHELPMPELNVEMNVRGQRIEADCVWHDQRLIVELDGRDAHDSTPAFEWTVPVTPPSWHLIGELFVSRPGECSRMGNALPPSYALCLREYPAQRSTGTRGYFGKRSSVFDRSHSENVDPRRFGTSRWKRQESHKPAGIRPTGSKDYAPTPTQEVTPCLRVIASRRRRRSRSRIRSR